MPNYTETLVLLNITVLTMALRLDSIEKKLDNVIKSNSCLPNAQLEMFVDTIKALRDMNQGAYSLLRYDERRTLRELREARETKKD